jgi:hypothetical protein
MSLVEKARPGGAPPPRRGRARWLLLLALGAALALLWWLRREDAPPPAPAPAAEAPAPAVPAPLGAEAPAPEAEPAPPPPAAEPAEPLPPLAESDALAREAARGASRHPLAAQALRGSRVIDRFVTAVDQVAEGKAPRRDLDFLRPEGPFLVLGEEPELRVDPGSYRRYDALAAAFASLDAAALVAAYRRLAPLCEESYRALGYPEGGFEARLRAALALLAATPKTSASPALVAETRRYEFADPNLENLPDAQKQLLRMGPQNVERIVAKVREIEAAL